ncbi:MAG TPA: efflux RND transporter periplasmic adaptor subunit [Cytophagaceae bacterium]|nr:efflux RND transporter periplasmic adaptor subunit [Cytophagaceae bacterium]
MRQKSTSLLIFIGLAGLAFFTIRCTSPGKNKEKGKNTPLLTVNGIIISSQVLDNNIEVIGTILPNEKVELRSEASGRITSIFFKEDGRAKKGDLLVKIFDQELRAQLKKVKIQQDLANLEAERKKKLLEISGISQEEYDIATNQASSLSADAELIEAQLAKTEIRAPFDGVIGLRYVSEGEYVSSATLIATLQQIDPVKIEFDIPEKYGVYVNKGSTIRFTVTGSDKTYNGTVYAIEPMIDVSTRTFKVRARTSNNDYSLRPGSFIKVNLLLAKNKNAILVPTESIVSGVSGQKLFVSSHGVALSRKVITGIRNERTIQITDGLQINDTVITSGIMQLKDSTRVNIKIIK